MIKNKKVLILGGEGFIGRNLADFLAQKYDCVSIDMEKSPFARKNRRGKFIKINPYENEIKNDYDAIIHLIDKRKDRGNFEKNEKKLIKNLGISLKNHLIIFSSAVVYADPKSDYGKRKLKLEKIYSEFCKKNEIPLTIVRLFNAYGNYQIPQKQGSLVANLFCDYFNNRTTQINDINSQRDFVFAQDIAKIIEYIIKNKFLGLVDLSTNKLTSIKRLATLMGNVLGGKLNINNIGKKEKIESPKGKNILLKKVKLTLLEKGLKDTKNFYERNINIINKISEKL